MGEADLGRTGSSRASGPRRGVRRWLLPVTLVAAGAMWTSAALAAVTSSGGSQAVAAGTASGVVHPARVGPRAYTAGTLERYQSGEVLVKFRPGATLETRRNLRIIAGGVAAKRSKSMSVYRVALSRGVGVADALRDYRASPQVEYAEPNYLRVLARTPNDTYYRSHQWNMDRIGADHAWDIAADATSTIAAVIDSGLDLTHPDLDGNVWTNPGETAGNFIDDDGNGYVDDVNGWNFADGDADPSDQDGHGTHVAGIIAAETNNGQGVAGVAGGWGDGGGARLMPLRVTNSEGLASDFDIAEALAYAGDNGARVVNMSLAGFETSLTLQDAVDTAYHDHDLILVAAAGNQIDGAPFPFTAYPAAYEHVTAVAATNSSDHRPSWSNYGRFVDVAAPGDDVASTYWNLGSHVYAVGSGTSMASPHVAGQAALLSSYYPEKTGDEIRTLIQSKCRDLGPHGKDYYTGYGRINVGKTIDTTAPSVSGATVTSSFRPLRGQRATFNYTIADDHYTSLRVIIYIYNRYGRVARQLGPYWKTVGANQSTWNGRNWRGDVVGVGTYRTRIRVLDSPGNYSYSPYRNTVVLR